MKWRFSTILLLLISFSSIAQVNFETTINNAVYYTNLEDAGDVYYGVDYTTNECQIYKSDYSLWKTISIVPPTNTTLYDVAYVTTKLFNGDSQVELLAVFSKYVMTSDTSGYLVYSTKIINEAGVPFLTLEGAGYSTVYNLSNGQSKLLCFVYDFSVSPYTVTTNIYGIPGSVSSIPEQTGLFLGNAFPNPASTQVNIPISPEFQDSSAKLTLLDVSGKVIKQTTIPPFQPMYLMQTHTLKGGTYFYYLEKGSRKSEVKKLVIS